VDWKSSFQLWVKDHHALPHLVKFNFNQSRITSHGLFKIQNQDMLKNQECQVGAPCRAETPSCLVTLLHSRVLTCMSVLN
jgi:hypothetical protein